MKNDPFETALNTLRAAGKIAGLESNAIKLLSQPKRIFEFTIPTKYEIRIFNLGAL